MDVIVGEISRVFVYRSSLFNYSAKRARRIQSRGWFPIDSTPDIWISYPKGHGFAQRCRDSHIVKRSFSLRRRGVVARLAQRLLVRRDRNPFGNFICARNKLDVIKRGEISALSSKVQSAVKASLSLYVCVCAYVMYVDDG